MCTCTHTHTHRSVDHHRRIHNFTKTTITVTLAGLSIIIGRYTTSLRQLSQSPTEMIKLCSKQHKNWALEMGWMLDYDIRKKPKVWAGWLTERMRNVWWGNVVVSKHVSMHAPSEMGNFREKLQYILYEAKKSVSWWNWNWNCINFSCKCIQKPTESQLSLMRHKNKSRGVEQNKDVKRSNSCYIVPSLVAVFQKLLVDSTDFHSVSVWVVRPCYC